MGSNGVCNTEDRKVQEDVFRRMIRLAVKLCLPICVHLRRDVTDHGYNILIEEGAQNIPIHLHCFSEDGQKAQRWIKTFPNLKIGVTPLVINKSCLRKVVRDDIPLKKLVLETDSPYFGHKSKHHDFKEVTYPGCVNCTAEEVADIKKCDLKQVFKATNANVRELYGIDVGKEYCSYMY